MKNLIQFLSLMICGIINRIEFYELNNDAGTLQVIGYDTNVLKEGEVADIENISIEDLELEFVMDVTSL